MSSASPIPDLRCAPSGVTSAEANLILRQRASAVSKDGAAGTLPYGLSFETHASVLLRMRLWIGVTLGQVVAIDTSVSRSHLCLGSRVMRGCQLATSFKMGAVPGAS